MLELAPLINLLTEVAETLTQGDFGASRLQGGGSSALGESSGVLAPWSMKTMQLQFF